MRYFCLFFKIFKYIKNPLNYLRFRVFKGKYPFYQYNMVEVTGFEPASENRPIQSPTVQFALKFRLGSINKRIKPKLFYIVFVVYLQTSYTLILSYCTSLKLRDPVLSDGLLPYQRDNGLIKQQKRSFVFCFQIFFGDR